MNRFRRFAAELWERMWFQAEDSRNLAAARIIIAAHSLWFVLSRDYAAISGLTDFWEAVPGRTQWRFLLFPGHETAETLLQWVLVGALLMALCGIWTRASCLLSGLLCYHLAPMETIFWSDAPYGRGMTLAPIAFIILSVSRCGDAFALFRSRNRSDANAPSWEYGWPLRLLQVQVAQIYVFAALAKLRSTGLDWSSAENIRGWFTVLNVTPDAGRFHDLGLWIAGWPSVLLLATGIAAVVAEWSFIFAPFSRIARRLLVPAALPFHALSMLTLNIHIGEGWLVIIMVNWAWVTDRWVNRRRLHTRVPAVPG